MAKHVSYSYTQNEAKVYSNSCLIIIQELELLTLESEFKEILDLLELFGQNEDSKKLDLLNHKVRSYIEVFEPKIKDARRTLKNTDNRLKYNMERCC